MGATVWGTGSPGPDIAAVISSPFFLLGLTGAFAASLWAAWLMETRPPAGSPHDAAIVMSVAVILRLMALPADPGLSEDVYRYMWDGHVQSRGINPYLHAPADDSLDSIGTDYRPLINNPELPTIYPPVSQMVFFAAALAGGSLVAMKALLLVFDGITILALVAILKARGMAPARVVIYAWSPLAVIEVGWSGHLDSIGVCLLMLAILAMVKGRPLAACLAAALSGAARYAGWVAVLPLGRRARWRALLAVPAVAGICYLPYASAGTGILGSLFVYAEHWRFNDSLFGLIASGVDAMGFSEWIRSVVEGAGWLGSSLRGDAALRLTDPLSIAKGIAVVLFALFALRILGRRWEDPAREILALTGGALLLSPTLHPWYLLWVAPLLVLAPRVSWAWLTWAAMVFGYPMMAMKLAGAEPPGWLLWAEYAPFYAMLAVESARRRLWEEGAEGWRRVARAG